MHLDPEVVQKPQPPDPLHELVPFERMGRPRHDVYVDPASSRPNQPLDDHRVLETLILHEELVPRFIDELADSITPGPGTPDQMPADARRERLTVPVGLETVDDLLDIVLVVGH